MPRGRKPKPGALKELQGNPGKKRKAKVAAAAEPVLSADAIAPPLDLKPAERRVWDQLVPLLRERKFVQATDLLTFTRYCKFFSLFADISPKVNAKNMVKVTKSDFVTMERLNKWFLALLQLDKRLCEHEANFGLNPVARQTFLARQAAAPARLPFDEPAQPDKSSGQMPAPPAPQPAPSPIGIGRLN